MNLLLMLGALVLVLMVWSSLRPARPQVIYYVPAIAEPPAERGSGCGTLLTLFLIVGGIIWFFSR